MLAAFDVSLTLMAAAFAVAAVVAVLVALSTLRRGLRGRGTQTAGALAAGLTAMPEFMLSSLFLAVFSVRLGWLPPYGWQDARHVILPALARGLPAGGLLGRLLSDGRAATFSERWIAA